MKTKKFNELKVGDTVVLYEIYSKRFTPREEKVTKIGRQYIFIDDRFTQKYNKETGYGEYGFSIYPGTLEEYNEYVEVQQMAYNVSKLIVTNTSNLNRNKLEQIINIINDEGI
jgi:hypothetical protein